MRFREVSGSAAKPGTIEVHIIRPGRGSSGYYSDDVLKKACEDGVYPSGMLMHWDHPTRQQEEDQPARVTGTIAAALNENAQYRAEGDPNAWDGPGPYAIAEVRPKFAEDLKWMAGKIGVSHYVDGKSVEGKGPDGKKGRVITELVASPFNSVDFVTIPGAGGHSKFNEVRLRELSAVPENPTGSKIGPDATGFCALTESDFPKDMPMSEIRKRFAYDGNIAAGSTGKDENFSLLKLPHHDPVSGDVRPNCVRAALQAIPGGRTGKPMDLGSKTKEVTAHLEAHLAEIDKQKKEHKMSDKQFSLRLTEIMQSDPDVIAEIRKQVAEDLKIESLNEAHKAKLTEAETKIKALESKNKDLQVKIAESAARDYVVAEVGKAKLTETVSKSLTETLVKQAVLAEDGTIDTVKFGTIVAEAIKAKQEEIAAILKESGATGIHDNGTPPGGAPTDPKKAREELRDTYLSMGKTKEQANRMAGIEA